MTEQRAREAGVGDQVQVHLCDYRDMPPSFEHAFDAMVTSEMIEVRIRLSDVSERTDVLFSRQ